VHSGAQVPGGASAWASRGGRERERILATFPYFESEDVDEALRYAASLAADETLELIR